MKKYLTSAGTKSLEQVTRVDPVMAQRYKIGEVDARDLMIKAGEAGNFNIKKFREAMGYTDEATKEASMAKWTEMFGGGAQGKAAANDLRQMIDILDKEYGKLISDSQQFIMRRLILQGGAAGRRCFCNWGWFDCCRYTFCCLVRYGWLFIS